MGYAANLLNAPIRYLYICSRFSSVEFISKSSQVLENRSLAATKIVTPLLLRQLFNPPRLWENFLYDTAQPPRPTRAAQN